MKMGTIASPWRYDVEPCRALQSATLRPPAISRYAFVVAFFRISQRGPVAFDSGHRDRHDAPAEVGHLFRNIHLPRAKISKSHLAAIG